MEAIGMACFKGMVGFIWNSVSPALQSFLHMIATEAVPWIRNWCAEKFIHAPLGDSRLENYPHPIVGAEDALSEFYRLMEDEDCKIIGIYGMGGIGKTTLLQKINSKFSENRSDGFNLVIFIEVTRDTRVELIQKDILSQLGLDKELSRLRDTIFKALCKKKFLLLLDNLWDKLDLVEIGVPIISKSRPGSKIVFTTRSAEVCIDMGASRWKFEMPLLNREKSWELFCQNLGKAEEEWSESTRELAEEVASKCDGLPLALITVARAMADVTDNRQWEAALVTLGSAEAVELRSIEEEVLRRLKFSYDRLREDRDKKCLLYCALFPEALFLESNGIHVESLIRYWVGEGLLDEGDLPCSIQIGRNRGLRVITTLKAACLLQDGGYNGSHLKLHDVVRQMALWITSGRCAGEETIFLVNRVAGPELTVERWTDSTRISLKGNEICTLPPTVHCPKLRTLRLDWNDRLSQIPGGFFQYMPILTLLDLSWTGLRLLPPEINLLVELRFLDLSGTKLESLPRELGGLTKLRILDLAYTENLKRIPREAISSLYNLQSLVTYKGGYVWRGEWQDDSDSVDVEGCVCLKDLERLAKLEELGLNINTTSQEDFHGLLDSRRLCLKIKYLFLEMLNNSSPLQLCEFFGATKHMRILFISNCAHLNQLIFPADQLTKLEYLSLFSLPIQTISWKNGDALVRQPAKGASFKNLRSLDINDCPSLQEITWTKELPCLETLVLSNCPKMKEIIGVDESITEGIDRTRDSFFPKLTKIDLMEMQNLKSICDEPLFFPTLEHVFVEDCPELKRLPFGLSSAKNIKSIYIRRGNGLVWDSEAIQSKFTPYLSVE